MRRSILFAVLVVVLSLAWRTYMLGGFSAFSEDDIPDLTGKVAVVTGANTGLGFETARALAEHGAIVVLGCRNHRKCKDAAERINEKCKAGNLGGSAMVSAPLDLSDAASVEGFARSVKASFQKLDFLVNNAAVMNVAEERNKVGFEIHLATNHVGHFLLTGHLLDLLKKARGRVVNHSSSASASFVYKAFRYFEPSDSPVPWSGVNMSDLNWEHRAYDPYAAYTQTKRANLFFTHQLNARFNAAGVTSTSCEPGGAATDLQKKATGMSEKAQATLVGSQAFFATAADGALMQTYATVRAKADEMIVPLWGMVGPPVVSGNSLSHLISMVPVSYDVKEAEELWEQSEKLTGMIYDSHARLQATAHSSEDSDAMNDKPNLVKQQVFLDAIETLKRETAKASGVDVDAGEPEGDGRTVAYAIGKLQVALAIDKDPGLDLVEAGGLVLVNKVSDHTRKSSGIERLDTIVEVATTDGKLRRYTNSLSIEKTAVILQEAAGHALANGMTKVDLVLNRLIKGYRD